MRFHPARFKFTHGVNRATAPERAEDRERLFFVGSFRNRLVKGGVSLIIIFPFFLSLSLLKRLFWWGGGSFRSFFIRQIFNHTKISKIHSGVSTEKSRRDREREITEDQERQRKRDNRTAEETEKES